MAVAKGDTRFLRISTLLGLASVVVVGLGVGAIQIANYFRRSADGVLRDYTVLAAERIAQSMEIGLARTLYPIINAEYTALLSTGWVPTSTVLAATRGAPGSVAPTISAVFVRSRSGQDLIWPDSAVIPESVRAVPIAELATDLEPNAYFAMRFDSVGRRVVIFNTQRDDYQRLDLVYGVVAPVDSVHATVDTSIAQTSALPSHVTYSLPDDSVRSVRITTVDGAVFLDYPLPSTLVHSATRSLTSPPGLIIEVALAAQLEDRLVHGGPPTGVGSIFAGLATLALLLLAAAALLWRQDRRLVQLREQFVAGVSHELRTPLAQIRLFAETLALGRVRDSTELQHAHGVLEQETRRLTHLVENLLMFSRQERGQIALRPQPINLSVLVSEITSEFEPLARAAHSHISVEVQPDLHAEVDPDAFRQVLLNLLDNAIKYGPSNQTVALRLSASEDQVTVTIEDEGPGVPREYHTRIWDRFWRGPGAAQDGQGGSGIGLSVVRELVELHRGNVSVDPASDSGARFVVHLPRYYVDV